MKNSLLIAALAAAFLPMAAGAAGTLTYCSDGSPEGFDPAQYETVPTEDAAGLPLYDKLLAMKPGTSQVVPSLAESWEVSADGRVYTFHLRKGVKFHTTAWFKPTREMNADDVVWSLERINDKNHPAHAGARNGFPYWAGMSMNQLVKSIAKVDPMTVRIALTQADASFPADLTISAIGAVFSAEYGEQLLKTGKIEQLNTMPVGTGPFVLRRYEKDAQIRYAANPDYWNGVPKIDTLIFAITPDSSVRVQRIKAGECLVAPTTGDQIAGLEAVPGVSVVRAHPLTTSYISPNSQHPFLSDKRFREALSLAIDRATFVKTVYGGQADPATSFLPPGIWSHDASLANPHDVEKAKALVKASGYDGRELTLFATARAGEIKRGIELLQSDWAAIGVKVTPQLMELGELYKRTGKGDHDLALLSWFSDNGDPDNFLTPNLSCAASTGGGNKSHWCNKDFDALLDAGKATSDLRKRAEIYVKAQKLIHAETALIPLANKVSPYATSNKVSGFVATPFGSADFHAASVR